MCRSLLQVSVGSVQRGMTWKSEENSQIQIRNDNMIKIVKNEWIDE